jgi:hypothetical protein
MQAVHTEGERRDDGTPALGEKFDATAGKRWVEIERPALLRGS